MIMLRVECHGEQIGKSLDSFTSKVSSPRRSPRPGLSMRSIRRLRAFTLIEILVVVAIIALMIAILLPSLARAREQAKIASCKANCKQIATLVATYQTEYAGYVPIILNYYANGVPNHEGPAKNCWLSVAFRKYTKGTSHLREVASTAGGFLDPDQTWTGGQMEDYENRLMPEFFMCPFERGHGKLTRPPVVSDSVKRTDYYYERGRYEGYQTAMWPYNVIRGKQIDAPWPGGSGPLLNGIAKFSTINWNYVNTGTDVNKGSSQRDALLNKLHRKWKDADARDKRNCASLADLVSIFCAQGEHMVFSGKANWVARDNMGSHKTTLGGGTNIIFADSHVEWVLGTRMGWP